MMLATASVVAPAYAQGSGEAWTVSLGGKLYDNQWLVTGKSPPEQRNPDYPKEIKTAVGNTWRCVSCHGWDYSGRKGHLGKLGNSEVFASLREAVGKNPAKLTATMGAPGHKVYLDGLAKDQIDALARFVSVGQFDSGDLIPAGKSIGDPLLGKDIFEGACVSCHQADGKAYIQGESGDKPALGWVAQNRPAQALHKIANGVPGADMLSLRFLPAQRLANLLAYLQTLDSSGE